MVLVLVNLPLLFLELQRGIGRFAGISSAQCFITCFSSRFAGISSAQCFITNCWWKLCDEVLLISCRINFDAPVLRPSPPKKVLRFLQSDTWTSILLGRWLCNPDSHIISKQDIGIHLASQEISKKGLLQIK